MRFSKEDGGNGGNGADYRYDRELPNGTYDADVLDSREDKSKKGNDMVVISFGVTGPHGGVRIDEYVVGFFVPKVDAMIRSLAPDQIDSWESSGEVDLNPRDLVGRSCRLEVKNEEWEGRQRPKVSKMLPLEM